MLSEGKSVDEVAAIRQLAANTIYTHAATLIEQGHLRLEEVVKVPQEELDLITDVMLGQTEEPFKLRPVFEELGGAYDYNLLRCVYASLQNEIAG